MKKKDPILIGEAMKEFFSKNNFIKEKIAEHRVLSYWKSLPKEYRLYTSSIRFERNGILRLHVSSPSFRQNLQMIKGELIRQLNEVAQMEIVKDIIIR